MDIFFTVEAQIFSKCDCKWDRQKEFNNKKAIDQRVYRIQFFVLYKCMIFVCYSVNKQLKKSPL